MSRRLLWALRTICVVVALIAAARAASAHGGNHGGYTPPPPPTPPPTPPPPPPPPDPAPKAGPVPLPTPPTTSGDAPSPTTPTEPGTPPTPSGRSRGQGTPRTGGRAGRAGAARTIESADWQDWWNANGAALRAARPIFVRETTGTPPGDAGAGGAPGTGAELALRSAVDGQLLPTLRAVLASVRPGDADTIASCCLALAKTTDDPADALRIVAVLNDRKLSDMVRESAAIALGCLRRTSPPPAFDGRFYDGLRATLFAASDDPRQTRRTRCFAVMALGVLGDQETDAADLFAKDGRLAIRDLWMRLERPETDDDTAVSLLVALSLQNPRGVPSAVRVGLKRLAQTGDSGRRRRGIVPRAHALLALARLGDGDAVAFATVLAKSPHENSHLRRSALLALGLLAPRMEGEERLGLAKALLALSKSGEPNTAGLALVAAARLLAAEFGEGRASDAAVSTLEALAEIADHGAFDVRPFAALAVGVSLHPTGVAASCRAFVDARARILERLRHLYADESQDPLVRGAFAVALGIAVDTDARALLEATVASKHGAPELAAYACAGLGLLPVVPASTLAALRAALSDRSSEMLQLEAAKALGQLGDLRAVPALLADVERRGSDAALARAIQALGSIHDVSTVAPLCAVARSTTTSDLPRALACAGLGLLGDVERVPSLARLGVDSNYLARTEAWNDVLSLL